MVSSSAESEWDEAQQNWMLALASYRDGTCPLCGSQQSECTAEENQFAFEASAPIRCHRTTAILQAAEATDSKGKKYEYKNGEALMRTVSINPLRVLRKQG